MNIEVYNPHSDLRPIGFRIIEVFRDMFVLGQHYVRSSDNAEWQKCPLEDQCDGFLRCRSSWMIEEVTV